MQISGVRTPEASFKTQGKQRYGTLKQINVSWSSMVLSGNPQEVRIRLLSSFSILQISPQVKLRLLYRKLTCFMTVDMNLPNHCLLLWFKYFLQYTDGGGEKGPDWGGESVRRKGPPPGSLASDALVVAFAGGLRVGESVGWGWGWVALIWGSDPSGEGGLASSTC